MALWGVNLPLAFTGSEFVWKQLYLKYGLTEADLAPYFSGPAFLPWQRMGNMRGWGGPLDDDFINSQRDLQKLIVARMRSFGMVGVRPVRVPCEPARTCGASPLLSIRRARSLPLRPPPTPPPRPADARAAGLCGPCAQRAADLLPHAQLHGCVL